MTSYCTIPVRHTHPLLFYGVLTSRQDLHVWVHIKQSSCQTTLSCRRLHPLTFELRQWWQLHRGAVGAVLGRALGSPLPLGLPHRLLSKAVHLLGGGDCRHFWRRRIWQWIQTSWCVLRGRRKLFFLRRGWRGISAETRKDVTTILLSKIRWILSGVKLSPTNVLRGRIVLCLEDGVPYELSNTPTIHGIAQ